MMAAVVSPAASAGELAATFAGAWSGCPAAALVAPLGVKLVELCAAARAAHPGLAITDHALVAAIASHVPPDADPAAFCARCRIAELALAHAASLGSSAAIAELERGFAATIGIACQRFVVPGHTRDDLRQVVREKLFVAGPGRPPAIARYNGQGSLESWVRVIAVRELLDLLRRKDRVREAPTSAAAALFDASDVGLEVVKAEYREAVAAALCEAARALEPGDRHLLRQHLVAGLSIDQLGAVLGVHRATAARRIARARDSLGARTRELLAARLQIGARELGDVIGLVVSKLDLSIARLLASRRGEPP